jgi:hypothetical protein
MPGGDGDGTIRAAHNRTVVIKAFDSPKSTAKPAFFKELVNITSVPI